MRAQYVPRNYVKSQNAVFRDRAEVSIRYIIVAYYSWQMKVWKLASVIGGTLSLVLLLQVSPLFFSSTAISSTTEAELNQLTHINRQLKGRDLTSGQADTCVAGYEGGDISTVNPYKAPIVMDGLRPLHYCGEFNGGSCCSNIMAQEITDGFEHLMNVGGTGGVPIDDERCLQYAKKTYVALKDYFCLFCNPRQIKYLGCCNPQYKIGGNCADPAKTATNPGATTKELMTVYGQGTCIGKASDTIRVCKTFAGKLWGTDGSKYDHCGMMTWVQHRDDRVADENAWSDKDDQGVKNGNPAGFMPWGDVDGRSGKFRCWLSAVDCKCWIFVL